MLNRKTILIVLVGLMPTIVRAQLSINSDLQTLIQKSISYENLIFSRGHHAPDDIFPASTN